MSDNPAEFKVMWPYRMDDVREYERMGCPRSVPWGMVEPHERQARANHSQTLQRLNQRGGLDPGELVAVLTGLCWSTAQEPSVSVPKLKAMLAEYLAANKEPKP